jgi:hypothetical protein
MASDVPATGDPASAATGADCGMAAGGSRSHLQATAPINSPATIMSVTRFTATPLLSPSLKAVA